MYNIYYLLNSKNFFAICVAKGIYMTAKKNDIAPYLFNQGTNFNSYLYLGAHPEERGNDKVCLFRVWAPNADMVFVCGDFCGWDEGVPMKKLSGGIWETEIRDVKVYDRYKYRIINGDKTLYKADPYAFHTETPPYTASKVYDISGYEWHDDAWMTERQRLNGEKKYAVPLNIYEMHLESWKRKENGDPYTYRELASELAPYIKQMGYTHIELLPVMEHPFGGSWGYQVTGYFAPTSRFGTPHDLMYFIDEMHKAGIGVILDWVPAHFPKDAHGLYEFDGQPLYEYQGADRMEHAGWGTRRFDLGRNEVESFLISSAVFWAKEYHCDGIRVDAVASMLYLDYDKLPGEWVPNIYGTNICLEATAFFGKLNDYMKRMYPDVLMIAEESAASVKVTGFDSGGLGFDYKWNMGWMNDALSYCELDPLFRKGSHNKLTFALTYAFSERFILPISHDEVVHGKKSLLDKMPGEYLDKFAGTRAFLVYMMTHPGKKLNFMGSEIGQFTEWHYEDSVEWFLLQYETHRNIQKFTADINNLYLSRCELWEQDDSWAGFDWMMADNSESSVISYMRYNKNGDGLLCVINFTPVERAGFKIGVPYEAMCTQLINSDDEKYGGNGKTASEGIKTEREHYDNRDYTLTFDLPAMSGVIFEAKRIPKRGRTVKKTGATDEKTATRSTCRKTVRKKSV